MKIKRRDQWQRRLYLPFLPYYPPQSCLIQISPKSLTFSRSFPSPCIHPPTKAIPHPSSLPPNPSLLFLSPFHLPFKRFHHSFPPLSSIHPPNHPSLVIIDHGLPLPSLLTPPFLSFSLPYAQFIFPSFFFLLFRGGVIGRPALPPPPYIIFFFSAGFRIWKEHMSVSSTLIIAPALSNSPQ